jgi:putative chitinase
VITRLQLAEAMDSSLARVNQWVEPLNNAMHRYEINTKPRIAAFLAQLGHESGRLFYVREIASGEAYEGRKDLGNTEPGDGRRFRGRGLIQITGRRNYTLCGIALELDLLNHPELLEKPEHAAMSAAWFWWNHKLNELADAGDFKKITRRINGGYNGLADRIALHASSLKALETV